MQTDIATLSHGESTKLLLMVWRTILGKIPRLELATQRSDICNPFEQMGRVLQVKIRYDMLKSSHKKHHKWVVKQGTKLACNMWMPHRCVFLYEMQDQYFLTKCLSYIFIAGTEAKIREMAKYLERSKATVISMKGGANQPQAQVNQLRHQRKRRRTGNESKATNLATNHKPTVIKPRINTSMCKSP